MLAPQFGLDDGIVLLCALAVFIGHLFPLYFRFQGGKGVATALGVLVGLNPGSAGMSGHLAVHGRGVPHFLARRADRRCARPGLRGLLIGWGTRP